MILFLKFLLAHLLGDFVFQSEKWIIDKEKNKIKSTKLYVHILIHTLLLLFIFQFNFKYWLGFLLIIISHYGLDLLKLYFQKKKNKQNLFFIDQMLHILMLVIVTYIYNPFVFSLEYFFTLRHLMFIISVIFVTYVSAIIIKIIITQWNLEIERKSNLSLAKAGRFIGILERLFVFIFIVTHHWEAIGFLLAAKSVFHFGDLTSSKDRKLTEYILIGTLLSFGLAISTGLIYLYLI